MVFSQPFEYFMYVVILLNIFPIALEFTPEVGRELELKVLNYIFCVVYVVEAVLKVGDQ